MQEFKKIPKNFNKPCKNGKACNRPGCAFRHDDAPIESNRPSSTQKINKQCKNGDACPYALKGTCRFLHSNLNIQLIKPAPKEFKEDISQVLCTYQEKCTKYPLGKCPFKHIKKPQSISETKTQNKTETRPEIKVQTKVQTRPSIIPSYSQQPIHKPQQINPQHLQPVLPHFPEPSLSLPVNTQTNPINPNNLGHSQIIQQICQKYILNTCKDPTQCKKLHEYTVTKSIAKYFSIDNCEGRIIKAKILKNSEQLIFAILENNKISFSKLTNLARQSGHQNISNNTMVLKRCYFVDVHFNGDIIQNFWVKQVTKQGRKFQLLFTKCRQSIKLIPFNGLQVTSIPTNKPIINISCMGYFVIFLFSDLTNKIYEYGPQYGLRQYNRCELINHQIKFIKVKAIKGEQIAAAINRNGSVLFIKKNLNVYQHKIPQKAKYLEFTQILGIPMTVVLTELNTILAINVLTFESIKIFQSKFRSPDSSIDSLSIVHNHLLLTVAPLAILVLKLDTPENCIGMLDIGITKSQIDCDQKGNLLALSKTREGLKTFSIFKVNKI